MRRRMAHWWGLKQKGLLRANGFCDCWRFIELRRTCATGHRLCLDLACQGEVLAGGTFFLGGVCFLFFIPLYVWKKERKGFGFCSGPRAPRDGRARVLGEGDRSMFSAGGCSQRHVFTPKNGPVPAGAGERGVSWGSGYSRLPKRRRREGQMIFHVVAGRLP
jgi:hypothetical protein